MRNFIVRTITAVFFVAAIVTCFLRPEAMAFLFAVVTGLTIWEFTGLVNEREHVAINRLICGPESVVLPLHHTPKSAHQDILVPFCGCKGTTFSGTDKIFSRFFIKKR